jgi:hypothetical protein
MLRQRPLLVLVALVTALLGATKLLSGCTTGTPIETVPTGEGRISGIVFKGAVAESTVRAFKFVDGKRGDQLATATTDEQGAFVLAMGTAKGALLLVASGGTYADEATPSVLTLSDELTALIPSFSVGTKLEHVTLSPISHFATTLALYHTSHGVDLAEAFATSRRHIEDHFGGVDWSTVVPTNLTTSTGAQLDQTGKAGLILAGLSMTARTMAERAGLTPGAAVNAGSLVAGLNDDLAADGFFDGVGTKGPILLQANVPATAVDGQTARTQLAQAISRFLDSDRNHSAVKAADAYALSKAIASADDPYLFRTAATADLEGPVIEWLQPAADSGVHGSARVYVTAHDPSKVTTFSFIEPASLSLVQPAISADGLNATLDQIFDVSTLPDGPITFKVHAMDSAGNESSLARTIHVANAAPEINVAAPRDGDVVKGTIMITASASVKNGTIAKLELRNPPPGVGADQLPSADSLAVSWDTTKAPEGAAVLTLHAEDTLGSGADVSVSVRVDNVPPGEITALVSTGAPLANALVQVIAVDDATGLATEARTDKGVLGQATTDETGTAKLVLTGENWDGPIQLRASGQALTYVDPSDGVTLISIPTTTVLSSFLSRYRTGEKISVPVTLWTTLADAAARGVLHGRNPAYPQPMGLTAALQLVDPLFANHIAPNWDLRQTMPVDVTKPPTQTLRDVVYAALPNVGLNSLARDLSGLARVTPGQVITAATVLNDLAADVESDGLFDGKGPGGAQLSTLGSPAQAYAANTTRFDLAMGVDHWLSTTTNATGLVRADLLRAGIYDAVTQDRSMFYPVDAPTHGFDSDPPVVQWQATFKGSDGSDHPPVGVGALVSGTVSITVDATDISGVKSIAVSVAGSDLTPTAGTAGHWEGSFASTTMADGPTTVTVTAADDLGNRGVSTFDLTVDNTKPAIVFASPTTNIFVGATVLVDATASDANGIVSLVKTSGFSGLLDSDATAGHFTGTWTVPAGQADGNSTLALSACDVVTNCSTANVSVKVDRTPPAITLVNATQVTRTPVATITVTPTDGPGAGVREVWIQVESTSPVIATKNKPGTWTAAGLVLPTALKKVQIAAWGVDQIGNSGQGEATPYRITATVTLDMEAPYVFDAPTSSYLPEQGLTLASETVPAAYVYASSSLVAVEKTAAVQKAASRVSYGASVPTPAQLETFNPTNTNNTPFLKFRVPYDAASDSALNAPTYTITTTGLLAQPPGGTLLGNPATVAAGSVYFHLPLSKETLFPTGAGAATSFTFVVHVTTTDIAGNTRTTRSPDAGSYTYTFVAPPMYVTDTTAAWSTVLSAPESAYNRNIISASYGKLWDGSGAIRYNRYVISNPSDVPVAVTVSSVSGSCGWNESITRSNTRLPSNWSYDYFGNGHAYHGDYAWLYATVYGSIPEATYNLLSGAAHPCTFRTGGRTACGATTDGPAYPATLNMYVVDKFACRCSVPSTGIAVESGSISTGYVALFYAYGGAPTNAETTPLGSVVTVPAATSGVPGRVSVYFARAAGPLPHSTNFLTPNAFWPAATFFAGISGFYGDATDTDYWAVTSGSCRSPLGGAPYTTCGVSAFRPMKRMTSANWTCSGSIQLAADANPTFRSLKGPSLSPAATASYSTP